MAAKIFYQEDCNLSLLDGKTIAIIGYGSQGEMSACVRALPMKPEPPKIMTRIQHSSSKLISLSDNENEGSFI